MADTLIKKIRNISLTLTVACLSTTGHATEPLSLVTGKQLSSWCSGQSSLKNTHLHQESKYYNICYKYIANVVFAHKLNTEISSNSNKDTIHLIASSIVDDIAKNPQNNSLSGKEILTNFLN